MDIKHLSRQLSNLIVKDEQEKRKQRLGITPLIHRQSVFISTSQRIQTNLIEPIVKDLCNTTKRIITFNAEISLGYYKLFIDSKSFAIIYIPNPASGKVLIKYLNHNGKQCKQSEPLNNTSQIISYLKEYDELLTK